MVGGAAEMRASNDDPTQEPMHGMLGRERNPAEHLKRTVRHFERGPRAVGLGDRRGAQAVGLVLVERCRGVEDARPRSSTLTYMSASRWRTAWKLPIVCPNWRRCVA